MSENPIEKENFTINRSELRSPSLAMGNEVVFASFLLSKDKPVRMHLRAAAAGVEEFRRIRPESRAEILRTLDRLWEEFKAVLQEEL